MFDIDVSREINQPISDVFAALSDHENYQNFPSVSYSSLLEKGNEEKNGIGALRKIKTGPFTLHERIVAYDAPYLIGYRIEYSSPIRFQHELGQITLTETPTGTLVRWRSTGHLVVPLLGNWLLDPIITQRGGAGFASILKSLEKSR